MNKLVALIILDGFALREEHEGNAVAQAKKPNFDRLWQQYPHNTLHVSGESVGLPEGQMGNSEVGHLNIGAGRIVYQSLTRINKAIEDRSFFSNVTLLNTLRTIKTNGRALHLFVLLSDGGVHSHINHLFALLKMAKDQGITEVYVHAFLDGRDVGPQTAVSYLEATEQKMNEIGVGKIASVMGRYYAMDRDQRWERVKLAYDAIRYGQAKLATDAIDAIIHSYEEVIYDEFVQPIIITDANQVPVGTVQGGDAIVFYNFRPDRAIQLSKSFVATSFPHFDRGKTALEEIHFVQMTPYSDEIQEPIVFDAVNFKNTVDRKSTRLNSS